MFHAETLRRGGAAVAGLLVCVCLLPATPAWASEQAFRAAGRNLALEFDGRMRSRIVARFEGAEVPLGEFRPSDFVVVSGREVADFPLKETKQRAVRDDVGAGVEFDLSGENGQLRKELTVTFYDDFPGMAILRARYVNVGSGDVRIDRWVSRRHLPARAGTRGVPFWSYQSGSYERRPDWVLPLRPGFAQQNYMGMNATDYGGGTPVCDVWRRDVGLGVGHVELTPKLVSLPVSVRGRSGAELGIEEEVGRVLRPGEDLATLRTFVAVHRGDYFATLAEYRRFMTRQGTRLPEFGDDLYQPSWCAWGYERDFTVEQVRRTLPKAAELGFRWATIDDGWQTAEGDWYPVKAKFPNGDADMRKLSKDIRQNGMRPELWWSPLAVDPGTDLIRDHPDYLLVNKDGTNQKISWWDAYYLCPAHPAVREYTKALVTKFIRDWDFDGLKIDGQHLNAAPPCYNPAHHHADPRESFEGVPGFFKLIYETARSIKPDALIEICPCGTAYAFHTMPYMGMPAASDPLSSWQIRLKAKTLKALMGPSVPYFGDHVELSDGGDDFASTIGVGGVVGTQFTLPGNGRSNPKYQLTADRELAWRKWVGVYTSKMLSKGEYLGELYDIGFDRPEGHAIRKDGRMYYAFYAARYGGAVELRGLEDRAYRVRDYVSGREYGAVRGPKARVAVRFREHLLLEAVPVE
jgi:alpha-galactosidase